MRFSKICLIIYSVLFITLAIIISKCLYFLNSLDDTVSYIQRNRSTNYNFIGGEFKNVDWLVQISDLHISIFHDPTRILELDTFCNQTLDAIKPLVVLATGDLTDAKTQDGEGSTQFEAEWMTYQDILLHNNVPEKVLWLDIRGNHDNFDVLNINSDNNYFRKYSIQGGKHPRSYFYTRALSNGEKIGLIGVDSCLVIGIRRPFNFVGQLTDEEMDLVKEYVEKAKEEGVSYLMWFGHYPTSTIEFPKSQKLREVIADDDRTLAYVCGHLHQIGGLVPRMYTYQREGFFELELGDWRGNRIIRIMAIDHGQFSFTDIKHGTWPIVLVTNPKTVLLVPPVENSFVPRSSHIRLLIFSLWPVTNVYLKIDDGLWKNCSHVGGPLYVTEWDETQYKKGLHVITVEAIDEKQKIQIEHYFSLDGSRIKNKLLPRLFLMPNLGLMFYFMFTGCVLFCTVPLFLFRYMAKSEKVDAEQISSLKCNCIVRWSRRLCILANLNAFFYPLVIYPIYLFIGPWAIVFLVGHKIGIVFAWGIIIDGRYEPSWITYPFGWKQMVLHAFLILHLARQLDRRCYSALRKVDSFNRNILYRCCSSTWNNLFYVIVVLFQIWETYNFWLSYGHLTLAFCPLTTWWIVMALWLKKESLFQDKEKLLSIGRQWRSTI